MGDHGGSAVDVAQRFTQQHGELTVPELYIKNPLLTPPKEGKRAGLRNPTGSQKTFITPRNSRAQISKKRMMFHFSLMRLTLNYAEHVDGNGVKGP